MSGVPIRLLYVSHSFPLPGEPLSNLGGMQRVAVELHAALARNPEVELSTRVLETSWEKTGVRMVPFMAGLLRDLPAQVRRERIDVVLFSSLVTASSTLLLRRRIRAAGALTAAIPVGRDVTLPNRLYQRLVPRLLRSLDLVLPISRATGDECLARGLSETKMYIVPCGVDLERFGGTGARAEHRERLIRRLGLGVEAGNPLLLFSVGRHQERKGFHWFVERVMPLLPPEVVFVLGGEGPMTARIRELVEQQGLSGRVHLLGRVSEEELVGLYRGADLFVMPNVPVPGDIEGFGVVMLEAGASGMPVVAAELEGIRDVVTPGENGELVESGNAPAFAEAILRLNAGRELLAEASARASLHTARRFGWDSVAAQHLQVLRRAVAGSDVPGVAGEAFSGQAAEAEG
jgi:phosphatidyl-myo-inositol dimannoside synthase